MRILKRLHRLWKLSEPNSDEIDTETLKQILGTAPIKGDGKAEFLPYFTEEEYREYEHNEVSGWQKFKHRFGL